MRLCVIARGASDGGYGDDGPGYCGIGGTFPGGDYGYGAKQPGKVGTHKQRGKHNLDTAQYSN